MGTKPNRAEVAALVGTYDAVKAAVTFTDGEPPVPDASGLASAVVRKVTLASLQECVKNLESRFSGNCDCLVNEDCCQTCQTTTCQSQYCQSQYCQSCQSSVCQSCQQQCQCQCNCSPSYSH